jgi:hypothetical protein
MLRILPPSALDSNWPASSRNVIPASHAADPAARSAATATDSGQGGALPRRAVTVGDPASTSMTHASPPIGAAWLIFSMIAKVLAE